MKGTFQLILIIIFIAGAIFGVLVFSGAIPLGGGSENTATGTVVLWGTTSSAVMSPILEEFNKANKTFSVSYEQKSADSFDQNLLEALASGAGPDMFFLPDNLAFHYSNKIFPIPYTSYPLVTFKNTFAGAGEVFLTSGGILAFPITIDPLMLYYNRSMLDSNSIIYPPKTWNELATQAQLLTKKDGTNKIIKSAVGLGDFSNVAHAKDILVAMFMQAGNPIVTAKNESLSSSLDDFISGEVDLGSILQYYISFADPASPMYSWNKSFPNSTNAFSSEDAAFYFGFASEFQFLVNRNPNQNLGVAPIPQLGDASSKLTAGRVTGLAISSATKNLATAFTAASLIATGNFASKLSNALATPPARRDLLAAKPGDSYSPIFYDSALYGKSWLDPSPDGTNNIFRTMVESTLSNNRTASDAVDDASSKLDLLLLR
ncbi:MAG TPA: extracellular solute-binding protein [Candidatus Paceibacterota bacterium]|jgi:ABC-type glycerol-3-phosphate transport system substrate-binding protein|nr:extracellular solute-binding protein [Candidatus Paceibacterota bacterium]